MRQVVQWVHEYEGITIERILMQLEGRPQTEEITQPSLLLTTTKIMVK